MSISEMINSQEFLLPEIQRAYAALYFENIHIGLSTGGFDDIETLFALALD